MKKLSILSLGTILILSIGITSAGCYSAGQFGQFVNTGKIEVRVTDAPPEQEITGIIITVSGIEIYKAVVEQEGKVYQHERQQIDSTENKQGQEQGDDLAEERQDNGGQVREKIRRQSGEDTNGITPQQMVSQDTQGREGWIELPVMADVNTFDLIEIKGIEHVLIADEIEAGKYTQLRLTIDQVQVTVKDEEPQIAVLPSDKLEFVTPIDISAGKIAIVILDFDAEKSATFSDAGNVVVSPIVNLSVRYEDYTSPNR
jgi:hypothetical protein